MASLLSGTTIGGYTAVHSNNISTYALTSLPSHTHDDRYIRFTGAELTEGNYYYFRSNRGSYLGGLDSATLQVYATGGNSAFMSFHRSGNYAVNFGLDADNVMRIGGWSAGADRWVLDMSGNNWVAGSFRAPIFYDSQDTFYYVDPNGRSRLSQLQTGGDISTNDSFGASLFSSFTADGKYLTRNWHHTDGGYTWPGMTYRTGLSDSAIGSTAMAGNGAWAGHRQRGWTPVDVTKTYKISVWIRTTSGNPYCYLSLTQATYDLSQPNNGGWGNPYFWAGVAPSSWTEYTMTIGPSGSGAGYNWNAGTKYVQLGLLHDYRYTGYAGQAEFTGFKIEELDDTLANNVTVMGNAVIHAGNIGSQSVNYASSAGSVAWTNVSSRPTALSQFTNDLGNYGGWLTTSGKAADSELVDGIDSSRIVFGDGARASSNSGDMNDPNQKSGFYFAYNPSGRPYEEYWNWITIAGNSWQSSNNYQFQLAHDFHSDRFYVRRMTNGSVASWREVITSGNIGSQSVNYAATAGSAPANGGNSSTVAGLSVHSGRNNEADKIVRTDSNGYIQAGWINTTSGARSSATRIDRIYASDDSYLRYYSLQDFKVALGLPRNSFNRHADYSTTEGYHTGIMGYGNSYDVFNSLPHFGSGFIDFWSGPSNAPDSDHWVGIQSFHAVNWNGVAGRNYGWQMVHKGGTTGDIRFNSQWSDNDYGWISIWNSANDGAGSGLDADLLDGQQGSYYINTSNIGSQSVNYAASAGSAGSATITEFQSIPDHRGSAYTPNAYAGNRVWWHFNNKDAVGGYGTYWHAIQTVSPWSSYDPSHRQQQIQWGGTDISFRYATSGTTWSSWFRFITDANIASQSVSYADESGYSASSGSVEWTSVQNKPATFAPSAHTHDDRYYTESESDGRYVPYGSITGSFGLNDNKLYLRTNGDNNHYLWNASDDWEELNAYEGTGFRITSNQGATGVLYVYGSSNGGYTYSPYSFRAPIFYDSADTNYYVDPNSTSMLYRVNSYYLSNPGDVADNHPYGIYFSSSLSTAYAIFREPGAWNHPYPDLRIAFHTGIKIGANAGYEGVRFYTDYDMSSQVMSVNNGSDPLGQGNVYVNNNLQAGSSLRAPIFYDSADTTYYGDFAGTSWLRHLSVGDVNASNDGGWNARLNLTGSSHARLDVKSNSDGIITTIYSHTGQGVGRVGTWSNHPLAFMVNGGIAGYAYANYLQGVDSVRAPIFYDSNDTGYYLDPNGTSNLLTVNVLNTYVGNAIYFGGGNNYFNWDGARINSNVGIQSTSDMRAPIFYDSNDTGYYGNFASFSRMSEIGVTNHYVYNYDSIESGRTTAEFGNVGKYVATRNATGDYPSFSFEHVYGTFAWGQIARFHIRQSGADRPSIQFSSGSSNDRWNIGFCTGSDNNFRISQNMGYRPDDTGVSDGWGTPRLIMNTSGVVDVPQGYVSNGNPWGTSNSAFFPNGITTAGSANWIYGTTTYIGNAPSNGAGHEFSQGGDQYSTGSIRTPTFIVSSHSDNTKGYRIYNTSGSSVSAMFVNSSNQLVFAAGAVDQINLNKKVYVNGVALGVNVAPSATAGRIDASNDIVAYSSSDERLKHNITPIENAIDKVKSLTGVEFDWKPEYKHAHGYEGHDTGIIAQQVQEVIPSAVRTNDTGFLAVRYEKLIGLLVEGMKEQQAQIEELKAKLDGLTK